VRKRKRPTRVSPRGVAYAPVIAFLLGFGALLVFVSYFYLFPALEARQTATPQEKRVLAAHSLLLLAVLLFILLSGLILTFRIGRFFLPRRHNRAKPTVYPDAWAESARRIQVDPPDERG
jgi:Na+/phosphate symporter